jgi:hypothetical protein
VCARGRWSGVDGMHKKCVAGHGEWGGGEGIACGYGGGYAFRDVDWVDVLKRKLLGSLESAVQWGIDF